MKSIGALTPQGTLAKFWHGKVTSVSHFVATYRGKQRHQSMHYNNYQRYGQQRKWRRFRRLKYTRPQPQSLQFGKNPLLSFIAPSSPSIANFTKSNYLMVVSIALLLINSAYCDEGSPLSVYNLGPEITTTEFNYAGRGTKKFGDTCDSTWECGFPHAICDTNKKRCQCEERFPATNHIDKCGKTAAINDSCFFSEQCEEMTEQTECRDGRCRCMFEMNPVLQKDSTWICVAEKDIPPEQIRYVDPTMIGILVAMALMFIIICVVLRLFSRARWRENRTIFNTPNPRLMNVSLLRENKLLHERRGSRMSVRMPSRQPSMSSLRPHSPNASIGSRRGSRGSGTSVVSTRSKSVINHHGQHHRAAASSPVQPVQTNVVQNADSVTVEISEVNA